jgi:hypothetical protein
MRLKSMAQATIGKGATSWLGAKRWVRMRPDVAVTVPGVRGKRWITKRVNNPIEGIGWNFDSL